MRTIAHISDLHFGRHDKAVAEALLASLREAKPHLIIVSGDLTQRARRGQFAAAGAFLERMPAPVLVVPGNHDVPLYNLARRFLDPLGRFRHFISIEERPFHLDDEIAVLGLNTARSSSLINGRISYAQAAAIRDIFARVAPGTFRILVLHHPLLSPPEIPWLSTVGRTELALEAMAEADIHLVLAGHRHRAYGGDLADHHLALRKSILVHHAGTAISTRRRAEANSYNLYRIESGLLSCTVQSWTGSGFQPRKHAAYGLQGGRWLLR
jgi:3',5'-cyclic AMP phosphodiesterase CpdA